MNSNGNISAHLSVLDGKNWDRWVKQMKVILMGRIAIIEKTV
jgi:hypothetical protein